MTAAGPKGMAWSCAREEAAGGQGQVIHQRAVGVEQAVQGSGHSPKLPEFEEHLDSTLRHWVRTLGGPEWSQELQSGILVGPLQFGIFQEMHFCKYMNIKAKGKISNPVCSLVRFLTMVVCA